MDPMYSNPASSVHPLHYMASTLEYFRLRGTKGMLEAPTPKNGHIAQDSMVIVVDQKEKLNIGYLIPEKTPQNRS